MWDEIRDEILKVEELNTFCVSSVGEEPVKLLDNISFSVKENDILGLVGETGSGKTVLINSVGRILRNPLQSEAKRILFGTENKYIDLKECTHDDMKRIWGRGMGFIPTNARERLNPVLTVGQQFVNIIRTHSKLSQKDARQTAIDYFNQVQMPAPERTVDILPQALSGGMAQRVIISIALYLSPRLLLADEPTMGLDVTIQKQVLDIFYSLIKKMKSSVILATRDMGIVANYCNTVAVLCSGQLVEFCDKMDFFRSAKHPYSRYLLEAAFTLHGSAIEEELELSKSKKEIELKSVKGCRFVTRCHEAMEECGSVDPPVVVLGPNHFVKCHKWKG
jgi:oligopeptide/dipeptide ABC transporter ATP-binding protein